MVKIVIADDNRDIISMVSEFLEMQPDFQVVNTFGGGKDLLDYLRNNSCDILLLDIFMPEIDGIQVLTELNSNPEGYHRPNRIVMLTAFNTESMISRVSRLGADYFVVKPIDLKILNNTLHMILEDSTSGDSDNSSKTKSIDEQIVGILRVLGVPSHVKGYVYLKDAINMVYEDNTLLNAITKALYPDVASKNNTTSSRVERAIRNCIEITWERGNQDSIENVFNHIKRSNKSKPTNSEFISIIVQLINKK